MDIINIVMDITDIAIDIADIVNIAGICYAVKYKVLLGTGNWARYINKDIESQASFTKKALKYLPNRLTPLYFKIYYEEENYLEVRTKLLIYPSPPYSKGLGI